jgi:putative colanic acid biosynthesis acetyltransferase WcaF
MTPLDARKSKPVEGGPSFGLGNRTYRALWSTAWLLLASWTPTFLHSWRRLILRSFGARIAAGAYIYPSVRIWDPRNLQMGTYSCLGPRVDCYSMASISLGAYATVSQDACLCAGSHDIDDPDFRLLTKPIAIGDDAWIAAGAFVGPGVSVGEGAVLGARGVTLKELGAWGVYVGNPASFLRARANRRGAPKP